MEADTPDCSRNALQVANMDMGYTNEVCQHTGDIAGKSMLYVCVYYPTKKIPVGNTVT